MSSLATKIVLEEVIKKLSEEIDEDVLDPNTYNRGEDEANDSYLEGLERAIEICEELM